ncbi:MAG: hypothetical protein JO165_12590 [Candidatus Eremiobacteraeota bacterium]|nr:hypothetical protein [Candidatus Eremiobacteraeota bacterium]
MFGLLLIGVDAFLHCTGRPALSGYAMDSSGHPYLLKLTSVEPGSPADRSGLHVGDLLDVRPMAPPDRYRLFGSKYIGQSIRVYVVHQGVLHQLSLGTIASDLPTWHDWLGFAGAVWMLLFAAVLVVRRPGSFEARILAMLLIGLALRGAFGWWISPWAGLDAAAASIAALVSISIALLATYSMRFARPPSRARRVLLWATYAVAISLAALTVAGIIVEYTGVVDPSSAIFYSRLAASYLNAGPYLFPVFCGVATAVEARGAERTRYLWAFIPLALLYVSDLLTSGIVYFHLELFDILNAVSDVALFLAPLGLTYSLLNRRLLDIGFALNRAAIFSGVSLLLVGAFVLAEWLLGDWLQFEGHSANLAVSALLALALGLSIRFVHGKVEHFVDHVMFRKRRDDEEAIRRMAREAPYITDKATLLDRLRQTLLQHADASFVTVLLHNGDYGEIDENDPALVTLRAEHARVDLHALKTAISGEWAYPMVARGRLVGALVLGPKKSQESYAPDESDAIAQLAHGVAGAIDVLTLKDDHERSAVLDAIHELSQAMHAGFERLSGNGFAQTPTATRPEKDTTP